MNDMSIIAEESLEIKDQEDEVIDKDNFENLPNNTVQDKSVEDEYDTDIEITSTPTRYDYSGKTSYIRQCYKEGVIPAGYFLRHINEKKLEMRHHGLGLAGIKPICSSLMSNGTITSLDLTDNWLGDQSVSYLMVMMKENCFITELILSNNYLTYKCTEMLALSLSENLQLTRLDLSQNTFDDRAANCLGDLIMNVSKLEYLNLSKNKLSSGCLLPFGKALAQTHNLTEFDLSWNHISGSDVKHFCKGLSENATVKKLNLGWNGFGSVTGMQEIGKMLKLNSTLEELDMSNNRITAEGAVLIGKGLIANNTLKILKIGQNPMQTAGCYAILSAIGKNANSLVTMLDFENIRVNKDFLELKSELLNKMNIVTGSRKPCRPSSSIHPMMRLKKFVKRQNLSLLKYFEHFDDAENTTLTKNDFLLCLQLFCQETNFELTDHEITLLVGYLDKNQNGFIEYKDFMELKYIDENDANVFSTNDSSNKSIDN